MVIVPPPNEPLRRCNLHEIDVAFVDTPSDRKSPGSWVNVDEYRHGKQPFRIVRMGPIPMSYLYVQAVETICGAANRPSGNTGSAIITAGSLGGEECPVLEVCKVEIT